MKRSTRFAATLACVAVLTLFLTHAPAQAQYTRLWDLDLSGRNALIVVPPNDFADSEYFFSRRYLEDLKATVLVTSLKTDTSHGETRTNKVTPDRALDEIDPNAFDLVVFVGGKGTEALFHEASAQDLALAAMQRDAVVVAFGEALEILANAGALKGRRIACPADLADRLTGAGATVVDRPTTEDGNLFTGRDATVTKRVIAGAIRKLAAAE